MLRKDRHEVLELEFSARFSERLLFQKRMLFPSEPRSRGSKSRPRQVLSRGSQLRDSKRKEIQTKAKQLDIDLFARHENSKEELMMNKVWFYIESKKVVDDFQKELIQFDK